MACSTRFEYTSAYENKWLKFPVLCTKTVSEYIVGKKKTWYNSFLALPYILNILCRLFSPICGDGKGESDTIIK